MPIVEMKAPSEIIEKAGGAEAAASFCRDFKPIVIEGLRIPNETDYEVRITREDEVNSPEFSLDLTEGPNEYPDYGDRAAFSPSPEQLDTVGKKIQAVANRSSFQVRETRITVWPDTTFLLQEEDTVEDPKVPEALTRLQEQARKILKEGRIRLVVSPEQSIGVATSKEEEPRSVIELLNQEAIGISRLVAETLGIVPESLQEPIIEVVLAADTPVSLEFDCKNKDGSSIPEELRRFVAEKTLFDLHKRFRTGKEQAEVWIRQNRPEPRVYTSSQS